MAVTVTRTDPLRNFKFTVEIIPKAGGNTDTDIFGVGNTGNLTIGFAAVSGVSVTNQVIPYREGGMNTHTHKMVGMSDFAPVTFSRGVFAAQGQLWRWQQFMHQWNQGNPDVGSVGSETDYRCDILVYVYDHPVTTNAATYNNDASQPYASNVVPGAKKLAYRLYNCWPGGYSLGDLGAGESSILVQQLTVHHEGFTIAWESDEINGLATVAN